uniref:Protein kinase domain-containing protein n=1 Tax=Auxenochlorella protothecoides TaxID=3075 RepID=A0A1D2ACQ6_AUXPR
MSEQDSPVFPPNFFESCPWSIQNDFQSLKEVGKGKDTVIYSAVCLPLGNKIVAVKIYDKSRLASTKVRAIKREVAMMLYFMRHRYPNVVELYGAFEDESRYFIVMEYCSGGDLLEKLLREKKAISERRVATMVAIPCLVTLRCLHAASIIHRDIKLENIFLDNSGRVKLGDFGLTMCTRQEAAISPVGTVEYMAPEVIALPPVDAVVSGQVRASEIPPNTEKVDIWALGVTFFELVTGRLPFEGKDKLEIKTNITEYRMSGFGPHVSAQCQDLIRSMLAYDPADRPSAEELLQHSFLALYRNKVKLSTAATQSPSFSLQAFTPGVAMSPTSNGAPADSVSEGAAPAFESSLGGSSSPGPSVRLGRLKSWSRASSTGSAAHQGVAGPQNIVAGPTRRVLSWTMAKPPPEEQGQGIPDAKSSMVQEVRQAVKRIFSRKSTLGRGAEIGIGHL